MTTTSPRHRRRWLHRPPPRHLPEGARLLGPRRRPQAARVHRGRRRRVRGPRPAALGRLPAGDARRHRRGLRARRRHGRHGLHLGAPRRDPAQQRAHQHAHARGRAPQRRAAATSTPRRPASIPSTSRPRPTSTPLREEDAYPAQPQDAYGWEKLITERLCEYYASDYGIETRIVRFHNIFGPLGTCDGGREKAPAAMCRKVASVEDGGEIEIWGDGEQTRSFCYIDDCVEGIYRLMQLRLPRAAQPRHRPDGHDQRAGRHRHRASPASGTSASRHVAGPQGVRGRNSDNTRLREVLGWEPQIMLEDGLVPTYRWIEEQVHGEGAGDGRRAGGGRRVIPRVDVLGVGVSAIDMDGRARRDRGAGSTTASSTTSASPACTASWRASATRSCMRIHNAVRADHARRHAAGVGRPSGRRHARWTGSTAPT